MIPITKAMVDLTVPDRVRVFVTRGDELWSLPIAHRPGLQHLAMVDIVINHRGHATWPFYVV